MKSGASVPGGTRIADLDSVRGVAAAFVVAYHCWSAVDGPARQQALAGTHSWLEVVLAAFGIVWGAGRAAVIVFFVLSGFVLSRSLSNGRIDYKGYLVKRLLRIYPAFLLVVVATWLLHRAIGAGHSGSSLLLARVDEPNLSPLALWQALALCGTIPSINLDLVTWSLVHEVRISLLFPLVLWSVRVRAPMSLAVYLGLSLACTILLFAATGRVAFGFVETTFAQTWVVTGYFLIFFAAGAAIAVHEASVAAWLAARHRATLGWSMALFVVVLLKHDKGPALLATSVIDYAHGIAALGIIALVLVGGPYSRLLRQPALRWLGDISYSLYLVHLPILYAVDQTLGSYRPWVLCVSVVVPSVLTAWLIARFLEFPAMALGRRLAGRVGRAPDSRAVSA